MKKRVLTIAGSDSSGSAGIQADIETFTEFNVEGLYAITAITAQNDEEVASVYPTPADVLTQQLSSACKGKQVDAVKIGMVATQTNVKAIVWFLHNNAFKHIVIDPVLHSTSGMPLLETKALSIFRLQLLPLATVITPNLQEAGVLAGMQVASLDTMRKAAEIIHRDTIKFRGGIEKPLSIIIKGGHLEGDAVDVLFDGTKYLSFTASRIGGPSPRGTGCRFSAAIAACLANGFELDAAVDCAKAYLAKYIANKNK